MKVIPESVLEHQRLIHDINQQTLRNLGIAEQNRDASSADFTDEDVCSNYTLVPLNLSVRQCTATEII